MINTEAELETNCASQALSCYEPSESSFISFSTEQEMDDYKSSFKVLLINVAVII